MNSCWFVGEALEKYGVEYHVITVIDNNDIDRVLTAYKPDWCFIEALWVVPEKFEVLMRLHPKVKFNVRLHSNLPFLIQDGVSFEWLNKYDEIAKDNHNFSVSVNSTKLIRELNSALNYDLGYTPNCYPMNGSLWPNMTPVGNVLSIGCLGAIRLLKNHGEQAVAAIEVANQLDRVLHFHINTSIFETQYKGILNNLRNIFQQTKKHTLYENEWVSHSDFISLVKRMDIGMQVSMSETFNIVSADFVSNGIPVVGSKEISFLAPQYQAEPTNFADIVNKLKFAINYKWTGIHIINEILLRRQVKAATKDWLNFLNIK
jgi:hypothetical protein